jgi:aspartate/methionine/tyrosine aminotransferase
MYAFSRLADQRRYGDSLATAKRLVVEAGLGLAPGNAFMVNPVPEAPGWLRWCFASRDLARLEQGAGRLQH